MDGIKNFFVSATTDAIEKNTQAVEVLRTPYLVFYAVMTVLVLVALIVEKGPKRRMLASAMLAWCVSQVLVCLTGAYELNATVTVVALLVGFHVAMVAGIAHEVKVINRTRTGN